MRTAADDVGAEDSSSFALSFDRDLPLVQADAAQLERVFVNLLENARRYSGGHPVKVRARVVGGKMNIRVIDRGPGMSPTQIARAFEPFYRDESSDAHPGSGPGTRDRPRLRRSQRRPGPRRVAAGSGHGVRDRAAARPRSATGRAATPAPPRS